MIINSYRLVLLNFEIWSTYTSRVRLGSSNIGCKSINRLTTLKFEQYFQELNFHIVVWKEKINHFFDQNIWTGKLQEWQDQPNQKSKALPSWWQSLIDRNYKPHYLLNTLCTFRRHIFIHVYVFYCLGLLIILVYDICRIEPYTCCVHVITFPCTNLSY